MLYMPAVRWPASCEPVDERASAVWHISGFSYDCDFERSRRRQLRHRRHIATHEICHARCRASQRGDPQDTWSHGID